MGQTAAESLAHALQRRPSILVVEDNVLLRTTTAGAIEGFGFQVFQAGTAAEAIEILEAGMWTIDLVFSDVQMPGEMDGFELSQWIRAHRPGLPVLLCSGRDKHPRKALSDGNEPFFTKPYDVNLIVGHICLHLREKLLGGALRVLD